LTVEVDGDAVELAVREVAAAEVRPRFRSLSPDQIVEKSPGDLVTEADRACERALGLRLRALVDIPVVGEEATAADPGMLDLVGAADAVWVVDPVDGTSNFVAGSPDHAVIVALVERGVTTRCWMHLPVAGTMLRAELGAGARRDGRILDAAAPLEAGSLPPGLLSTRYLPAPVRDRLAADGPPDPLHRAVPGRGCAPVDYFDAVDRALGYLVYWRTLPWDHAGPALFASEAGLRVARPGGDPYRPGDGRDGLIVAHPSVWDDLDAAFGRFT